MDETELKEFAIDVADDLVDRIQDTGLTYTEENKVWSIIMGEIDKRKKTRMMVEKGKLKVPRG